MKPKNKKIKRSAKVAKAAQKTVKPARVLRGKKSTKKMSKKRVVVKQAEIDVFEPRVFVSRPVRAVVRRQVVSRRFYSRILATVLLFTMGALQMRGVSGTRAFLTDREISTANTFVAGKLDFSLTSQVSTTSTCAAYGKPLKKTISITNLGNPFRYEAGAGSVNGAACDYVLLDAKLNGVLKYSGFAKNFDNGLTEFTDPSAWDFSLSFSSSTPESMQGQTCEFTFDFQGQQTRHDLPFPTGFSDFERSTTTLQAPFCKQFEVRSIGFWSTHANVYTSLLPVSIGATTTINGVPTSTYVAITSQSMVNTVFNYPDNSMMAKMVKQLLAAKFNIFNFHIDAYVPEGTDKNMDQIVAEADALLRRIPVASDAEFEAMKNLLEKVNTAVFVSVCSCEPPPPPNSCALALTKTADKTEAAPGDIITYHITLDNYGTKVCTGGGVRIHDFYPDTLEYVGYTVNRTLSYDSKSTGFMEWNFGSVYPNDPLIEIDFKLKVKNTNLQTVCGSTITNMAKYWSNETDWSAPVTAGTKMACTAPVLPKVVINEFLPNPAGNDAALKPNGEWVELYNMGTNAVDVSNWVLYDEVDTHKLVITSANTGSGTTVIPAGGFLVVYRNGSSSFALDNTGGDSVRLYDGLITNGANLVDSYVYVENAPEGKSFARIPDGSSNWVDPIPTPGLENVLLGALDNFGPALPEEGEDGYVAPVMDPANSSTIFGGVGSVSFDAPTTTGAGTSTVGLESVSTATTTPASSTPETTPAVDITPSSTPDTTPAADATPTSTPETVPVVEPAASSTPVTAPVADPVVVPEQPATITPPAPVENPVADTAPAAPTTPPDSSSTVVEQPVAVVPPEVVVPEAPAVVSSGTGE